MAGPHGGFTSTLFVLVEPSHPGNVGAAARALKTMSFSRLVLVAPRAAQVKADAEAIACGWTILDSDEDAIAIEILTQPREVAHCLWFREPARETDEECEIEWSSLFELVE